MWTLLLIACGAKAPPAQPLSEEAPAGLGGVVLEGDATGIAEDRSGPPRAGLPPMALPPPALEGTLPPEALARVARFAGAQMSYCAGDALGRAPQTRGEARVVAQYGEQGEALGVRTEGDGDEVLHSCLTHTAERLLLRDAQGSVTLRWTVPLDPRHVSPGAVLRGHGYAMGYTQPSPELPALMLALGFPEPIDGAAAHADKAAALAAAHHECGELLPPMAPRPMGVLRLDVVGGQVSEARVLSSDAKGEDLLSCVEAHYQGLALPGADGAFSYVVGY
ncbi:MAG: hypothetical protein H6740_26795 [Alphaproteobacteria bacterium]|nr:hypothetical protein [Alphaproteobacteria bacterium]